MSDNTIIGWSCEKILEIYVSTSGDAFVAFNTLASEDTNGPSWFNRVSKNIVIVFVVTTLVSRDI